MGRRTEAQLKQHLEAQKRYEKTARGKATKNRYRRSPRYKASPGAVKKWVDAICADPSTYSNF